MKTGKLQAQGQKESDDHHESIQNSMSDLRSNLGQIEKKVIDSNGNVIVDDANILKSKEESNHMELELNRTTLGGAATIDTERNREKECKEIQMKEEKERKKEEKKEKKKPKKEKDNYEEMKENEKKRKACEFEEDELIVSNKKTKVSDTINYSDMTTITENDFIPNTTLTLASESKTTPVTPTPSSPRSLKSGKKKPMQVQTGKGSITSFFQVKSTD